MQRFYASPYDTFTWPNGAVGFRPTTGPFDTLGPYAKVKNCPIAGTSVRLTCYAQGYADTVFSVPAATRYRGKRVKGHFTISGDNIEFCVMNSCKHMFRELQQVTAHDILEQAHATFDLVHPEHSGEYTESELRELWGFAHATFQAAVEAEQEVCTLAELEDEFNSPRGCPTGGAA